MKTGRTLMYDLASFVIHRGQVTLDDAVAHFPSMTREQVRRAMHNASARGLIRCLHNGQQAGVKGCGPGVYGPRDAKPIGCAPVRISCRVVVSVFDMEGVTVPATRGKRVSPLGGWV